MKNSKERFDYRSTKEIFNTELIDLGLTVCFIKKEELFFKECYSWGITPKKSIEFYTKNNLT